MHLLETYTSHAHGSLFQNYRNLRKQDFRHVKYVCLGGMDKIAWYRGRVG